MKGSKEVRYCIYSEVYTKSISLQDVKLSRVNSCRVID